MSTANRKSVDPWRRHKLIAIPFLVLILAVLMYRNFASSGVTQPIATQAARPARIVVPNSSVAATNAGVNANDKPWPKLDIDEIVAKNPFGPLSSNDAAVDAATGNTNSKAGEGPHSADSEDRPHSRAQTALANEKVQAIYQDAIGTAAIVDAHVIHPGDTLDNGVQILNVTEDGVTLKSH